VVSETRVFWQLLAVVSVAVVALGVFLWSHEAAPPARVSACRSHQHGAASRC